MSRLSALLALLLPVLASAGANVRVVPAFTAPLCGSCGAAGAGSALRLDAAAPSLGATLLAPALSQPTALAVPLPALVPAFSLPAAADGSGAPSLIIPGRAEGAPKKLIVAQSTEVEAAIAAAARQDRAEGANAAFAASSAEMMALFDGSRPRDADGPYETTLAPGVLAAASSRLRGVQDIVGDLRSEAGIALPGLRRSVALGQWNGPDTTLDGPCCGDAAPKLAAFLRMRGYPAMLIEAEFHFYVVVRTPEGDIVVDPTFRQFFGREKAPPTVPQVFVGTWAQLHGEFSRHRDAKTTRYGAQRIYRSEAKGREDLLRAAAAAFADDAAAPEHAALRPALRASARATGPQPLIIP